MKQIIITMLLLAATIANAQDKGKTPQDAEKGEQQNEIFDDYFEPTAHFPGGDKAYLDYIKKNMRYPEEAKKKGIEGRVLVQLYVETDGSLSEIKVSKSVDPQLDEEALRIVKGMPKWIPGRKGGEIVRMQMNLPITFRLEKEGVKK